MFKVFEDFKTFWVLFGSLLSGEGAVGVTKPLRTTRACAPFYRQMSTGTPPADEIVKSGPGILRTVIVNRSSMTGVTSVPVTIFDNTAASGNVLWRGDLINTGAASLINDLELEFSLGVFIDYGAAAGVYSAGTAEILVQVE